MALRTVVRRIVRMPVEIGPKRQSGCNQSV